MERYTLTIEEYRKALSEATDTGYRAHLVNDFVITPDGRVMPKLTIAKHDERDYAIHG